MKTQLKLAALARFSSFIILPSSLLAQGSLTPPGAPAPTMKSLAQVEPRTPISSAPFSISQPGSYYLTTNLTVSSGDAIDINTNGVTLDLNGFTIGSTEASPTGTGILLNSGLSDITIANGHIRGGVTNNGFGVYGGIGFANGINYSVNAPANALVSRVSVSGCLDNGISLGSGDSTVVESCTVRTVGAAGIVASTVKQSSALDCGISAILGGQVADCSGQTSSYGYGVLAITAVNCNGSSGSGNGVYAATAQNCYGYSSSSRGVYAYNTALNCNGYSGSGDGVYAGSAQNCYGQSYGSGNGVRAFSTENCYGSSSSGIGVDAFSTALNCQGSSSTGIGLEAYAANTCSGSSSGGAYGLYASYTAVNCYGSSSFGNNTGLSADVANTCFGRTTGSAIGLNANIANSCDGDAPFVGAPVSASHKYNMP